MKIKMFGYGKCSTCRKAGSFIKNLELPYESIDITTNPPSKKEIQGMVDSYRGEVKKVFNTSGQEYRRLELSKKLPTMPAKQAVELLAGNGRLIKRPFLIVDGQPKHVGFKQDEWQQTLRD